MNKKILLLLLAFSFISTLLHAVKIDKVNINGNELIETEYIETLITSKVNSDYDVAIVNNDIKRLYNTDFFSNINSSFLSGVLTINVVENPLLDNLIINGNDKIKSDIIEKEMLSRKRTPFSTNKIDLDIQRIKTLYSRSGYLSPEVSYDVSKKDFNRTDVTITIKEGEKTSIGRVNFLGNTKYSDSDLKSIIITKEDRWWRFFNAGAVYDRNRILYDGELLRQFYLENGYPNFSVVSTFAEFSVADNDFIISYTVEEGERYKFGEVSFLIRIPELLEFENEIKQVVNLSKNYWYRNSIMQRELNRIKQKISDLGFQFVGAYNQLLYNDITKTVDMLIVIDEEERVFIDRIEVKGNTRSKDAIVRRELKFLEGDSYNPDKINIATRNLYRTQYFQSVNITESTTFDPEKVNINVEVEETFTGYITAAGGYSTVDALNFELGYTESNLQGTGLYLGVQLGFSKNTNTYSLSVGDPYFLGRELSANTTIYRTDNNTRSSSSSSTLYRKSETGISFGIGYALNDYFRQSWSYSLFDREVSRIRSNAPSSIKELAGTQLVSTIAHTISFDSRDNALYPRSGFDASNNTDYAGIFGDVYYLRNVIKSVWYYQLYEDIVFSTLVSGGAIVGLNGQSVKIVDKFSIGGNTLRGFRNRGVGPIDLATGESLGGQYMYRGSLQVEVPIPAVKNYGLLFHVFTDFGNVTDFKKYDRVLDISNVRVSTGMGISWRSPAGIISLDYGYPLKKYDQDETESIFFNIGARV